jgi:hypothetical protein
MAGIIRRVVRGAGTRIALKATKAVPVLGTAFVVALAGYEIKKKGFLKGLASVALDATPILGSAKNVIEIFTGDWLPDKKPAK